MSSKVEIILIDLLDKERLLVDYEKTRLGRARALPWGLAKLVGRKVHKLMGRFMISGLNIWMRPEFGSNVARRWLNEKLEL